MKRFLLALALLCLAPFALSQSVVVSGTNVLDNTGAKLVSGQWCLGTSCLTVTNGAFSGSVTAATANITVVNGSTTYLTVPSITVAGSYFSWDTFIVPSNASISGIGTPRIACQPGAIYTQTDGAGNKWQCINQNGAGTWNGLPNPGTPWTVTVGSTTTLAAGSPATVVNVGNTNAAILNFSIPQGVQGIQGIPALLGLGYGAWSSGTTYSTGSVVTYGGNSYASFANSNLGHEPDTSPTYWGMLTNLSNLPAAFASQSAANPQAGTFTTLAAEATNGTQIAGNGANTTIQSAVNNAAGGSVEVPQTFASGEMAAPGVELTASPIAQSSYTNYGSTHLNDKRNFNADFTRVQTNAVSDLAGMYEGGDTTQAGQCAAAGACTVVYVGNSISENTNDIAPNDSHVAPLFAALQQKFPNVTFSFYNLSISGSTIQNLNDPSYLCETSGANTFYRPTPGSAYATLSGQTLFNSGPPYYQWPSGCTIGQSWYQQITALNPDIVILELEENSGNAFSYAPGMNAAISNFKGLTKAPSIVLVTQAPTNPAWYGHAGVDPAVRESISESSRYLALTDNVMLADPARRYDVLAYGIDPARRHYHYEGNFGTYPTGWMPALGTTLPTLSSGTMTFTPSTAGMVISANKGLDYTGSAAFNGLVDGEAPAIFYRYNSPSGYYYALQLARVTVSGTSTYTLRLYEVPQSGGGVVIKTGTCAFSSSLNFTLTWDIKGPLHNFWCSTPGQNNYTLALSYADYYSVTPGQFGIGIQNITSGTATVTTEYAFYGSAGEYFTPQVSVQALLGTALPSGPSDDYWTNFASIGGDGLHHPTPEGMDVYLSAFAPVLNRLSPAMRKADVVPISANSSVNINGTASDYIQQGPNLTLNVPGASHPWAWQEGTSGAADFWHYNGSMWSKQLSFLDTGDLSLRSHKLTQIGELDFFDGSTQTSAALPSSGGTITGNLTVNGTLAAGTSVTSPKYGTRYDLDGLIAANPSGCLGHSHPADCAIAFAGNAATALHQNVVLIAGTGVYSVCDLNAWPADASSGATVLFRGVQGKEPFNSTYSPSGTILQQDASCPLANAPMFKYDGGSVPGAPIFENVTFDANMVAAGYLWIRSAVGAELHHVFGVNMTGATITGAPTTHGSALSAGFILGDTSQTSSSYQWTIDDVEALNNLSALNKCGGLATNGCEAAITLTMTGHTVTAVNVVSTCNTNHDTPGAGSSTCYGHNYRYIPQVIVPSKLCSVPPVIAVTYTGTSGNYTPTGFSVTSGGTCTPVADGTNTLAAFVRDIPPARFGIYLNVGNVMRVSGLISQVGTEAAIADEVGIPIYNAHPEVVPGIKVWGRTPVLYNPDFDGDLGFDFDFEASGNAYAEVFGAMHEDNYGSTTIAPKYGNVAYYFSNLGSGQRADIHGTQCRTVNAANNTFDYYSGLTGDLSTFSNMPAASVGGNTSSSFNVYGDNRCWQSTRVKIPVTDGAFGTANFIGWGDFNTAQTYTSSGIGSWRVYQPALLYTFALSLSTAPTGCSTWPVYSVVDVSNSNAVLASITTSSGVNVYTTGKLATVVAMTPTHYLALAQTTAGVGCTGTPSMVMGTIIYK